MTDADLYLALRALQAAVEQRIPTVPEQDRAWGELDVALSDAVLLIECRYCQKAPLAHADIDGLICEACEDERLAVARMDAGPDLDHDYEEAVGA